MKARNPGNTVAATNPVFDLLMTSKTENYGFLHIKRKLGTPRIQ